MLNHETVMTYSLWFMRLLQSAALGDRARAEYYEQKLFARGVEIKVRPSGPILWSVVEEDIPEVEDRGLELVSAKALARLLGRDRGTISAWFRRGWIPGRRIGKRLYFSVPAVVQAVTDNPRLRGKETAAQVE
jgi:hypothetical protein